MFDEFVFGKDVFLQTDYPFALDSKDEWPGCDDLKERFGGYPLSLVADYHSGEEMAKGLKKLFPEKKTLLDFGTATGCTPLTMRKEGILALGLEGLNVKKFNIPDKNLLVPELFAWKVAPELVGNCDLTYPFKIADKENNVIQFDYIISTDCFEHLVTGRLPSLVDNIHNHLKPDGYGIFDINTVPFYGMHQTVQNREWWKKVFARRFTICEDLSFMDFEYVRGFVKNGQYFYKGDGQPDSGKAIIWGKKG